MREITAAPIVLTESLVRRFWKKVERRDDGCWLWCGKRDRNGYGRLYVGGYPDAYAEAFAHRVSYAIHFGPPPTDRAVLHHCDNPACVRPLCFFLGTQLDNMRDMDSKGRRAPKIRASVCSRGHAITVGELRCRECNRAHGRATARRRRERDPERLKRLKRESSARTRDRVATRNAAWYDANRERAVTAERRRRAERREQRQRQQ